MSEDTQITDNYTTFIQHIVGVLMGVCVSGLVVVAVEMRFSTGGVMLTSLIGTSLLLSGNLVLKYIIVLTEKIKQLENTPH